LRSKAEKSKRRFRAAETGIRNVIDGQITGETRAQELHKPLIKKKKRMDTHKVTTKQKLRPKTAERCAFGTC